MRKFLLRVVEPAPPGGWGMFGAVDRMHEKDRQHPRTPEKPSNAVKLHTIFDAAEYKDKEYQYRYDFGDAWDHEILITGRPEPTDRFVCTDGEGHGCAEDVGSTPGWEELKKAYKAERPNKEQREKMKWFETQASNSDSAGLKGNKVKSWPKTSVNTRLADLRI